jgi:uncharacterized protein YndB with AHSA1/START domain
MIKWIIRIVIAIVVAIALMTLIGLALPADHQASRSAEIPAPPATVFALIRDVEGYPRWRSGVTAVTVLDSTNGLPRFNENGEFGPIIFRMEQADAPTLMRTRIDDPHQPFGGTWTYVLVPGANGTLLTITEDGEVYNPLFRFLSRFVFSQTATIETYLEDVRTRLSSPQ